MKSVVKMLPFAALKAVLLGMRLGAGGWFWYPVGGTCDGCKGGGTCGRDVVGVCWAVGGGVMCDAGGGGGAGGGGPVGTTNG